MNHKCEYNVFVIKLFFQESFESKISLFFFNGTPEIYWGEGGDGNNGTRGREEKVDPEKK